MRFNEFKLFEANLSFGDFHQAAEERWDVFLNRVKGKIPWDGTIAPTLGGQEYDFPKQDPERILIIYTLDTQMPPAKVNF